MKLTVVLGASSEASFDIKLNDNSLVRKWTDELRWCLAHRPLDQIEAFTTAHTEEDRKKRWGGCKGNLGQKQKD